MLDVPDKRTKFILDLADYIEQDTSEFNMRDLSRCIIGNIWNFTAQTDALDALAFLEDELEVVKTVTAQLGISENQFHELCFPGYDNSKRYTLLNQITCYNRKQAAKVLRHLAVTNQVDWSIAAEPELELA